LRSEKQGANESVITGDLIIDHIPIYYSWTSHLSFTPLPYPFLLLLLFRLLFLFLF
jgi:hypothetical protein